MAAALRVEPVPVSHRVRRDAWVLAGLFVLALGVRLLVVSAAADIPVVKHPIMDGRQYLKWADEIASGDVLGRARGVFYQAPLYPYFLGACRAVFGDSLSVVRVLQAVFGAAACVMVAVAGRRVFSRGVGLAAGATLALYPPGIFFDVIVQKASIGNLFTCAVVMLVALLATGVRVRGRGWPLALMLGAVQGLLMLTREETILLVPVLGAVVWWFAGSSPEREQAGREAGSAGLAGSVGRTGPSLTLRVRAVAAFVSGLALALSPVVARNYSVGGELVLTTSQAGSNFYIGNNPDADGTYKPLRAGRSNTPWEGKDARDLAERATGRPLAAREVSRYWFGRSWDFMRTQPGAWARLMVRKSHLLVNWFEVTDSEDLYFFETRVRALRVLGSVLHMGLLVPMGVAGVVLVVLNCVRSRTREDAAEPWGTRSWRAVPLGLVLLTLVGGILAFYVFGRYRYPVVPLLALFGAAAVPMMVDAWRARRWLAVGTAAVAGVLFALPANSMIYRRNVQEVAWYINNGAAYAGVKQWDAAAKEYEAGLAKFPDQPILHANLGAACLESDRVDEAVKHLATAQSLMPGDPFLMSVLGQAYIKQGDALRAVVWLQNSLALYPNEPDALAALERVKQLLGERGFTGITLLAESIRFPDDAEKSLALAWFMATTPDPQYADGAGAVQRIEELIATNGTSARLMDALGAARAAAGDFEGAIEAASEAVGLARASRDDALAAKSAARIEEYRKGRRWVE